MAQPGSKFIFLPPGPMHFGWTRSTCVQLGEDPKPGDLIEIFRVGYQHWAIYVGDGYVVHLAPPSEYPGAGSSSLFSVLSNRAVVKRELLKEVVGDCRYRVNNYLDHKYPPLPVYQIISVAKEKVGEEMSYSVYSKNCEHFVTNLRYGKCHSGQVETVETAAYVTMGLGVLGALGYSVMRKRPQNQ
ncbi:phospholipase A and acyltransferase 4 [Sorex araneus]|uniref:phospholipase A and acyltransferase 4 n=1 Tax=Sorex araneus TaxID=42254 RepID=UPI00243392CF|nr:phospholipase A and acyltransferase 4 [Sorex araneus]